MRIVVKYNTLGLLREDHKIKVFETKLMEIFGSNMDEVVGKF
jgi:hypothetical protein